MTSEAALKAGEWWANQLFEGTPRFNNGGDGMAGMLATMLAVQTTPDISKKERFAAELAITIDEKLERGDNYLFVGVDYGPDGILSGAAERVECSKDTANRWPWKTDMTIRKDSVTVSAGYHGKRQLIWAEEGAQIYQLNAHLKLAKPFEMASMDIYDDVTVNPIELVKLQKLTYTENADYYQAYGNTPEECFGRIAEFSKSLAE